MGIWVTILLKIWEKSPTKKYISIKIILSCCFCLSHMTAFYDFFISTFISILLFPTIVQPHPLFYHHRTRQCNLRSHEFGGHEISWKNKKARGGWMCMFVVWRKKNYGILICCWKIKKAFIYLNSFYFAF